MMNAVRMASMHRIAFEMNDALNIFLHSNFYFILVDEEWNQNRFQN
jgi:hypothetical protein